MADFGSFSDLASVKGNEVTKPKQLPTAKYSAMITGPFKENKAKSGNFSMRYPIKLVECLDPEVAATIAEDELLQKAMDKDYHIDFWMSPDARWRFTEFATAMGVDANLDLLSMGEQLVALGEPFMVQGTNSPNQNDPESTFTNFDGAAPLPA